MLAATPAEENAYAKFCPVYFSSPLEIFVPNQCRVHSRCPQKGDEEWEHAL